MEPKEEQLMSPSQLVGMAELLAAGGYGRHTSPLRS